jgi:hypothetical protein
MEIGSKLPPKTWLGRLISAGPGSSLGPTRRDKLQILRERLINGAALPVTAAIPDIHGNFIALERIFNRLKGSGAERLPLGDAFDRRFGNLIVYRMLRDEKKVLLGNHEISEMLAMRGDINSLIDWIANGGDSFLEECGIDCRPMWNTVQRVSGKTSFQGDELKEALLQVLQDYPKVLPSLTEEVMWNPPLREVFHWLLKKGQLYHLDDNGILYIHGGIPESAAHLDLLDRLDGLETEFKEILTASRPSPIKALDIKDRLFTFLAVRGIEFLTPIARQGEAAVDTYLRNLGVLGLVCAHTIKQQVEVTAGRIFEIDLGMAHNHEGSFFTIGSGGPKSFREIEAGQFAEETLIEEGAWRAKMLTEVERLLT